jgi:hypothetical protein
MGEESTRQNPPGRWLASDGAWYASSSAPDDIAWVVVDEPSRLGCHPGLANIGKVYAWDRRRGGLQCSRCRSTGTPTSSTAPTPVAPASVFVDRGAPVVDARRILLKYPAQCVRCRTPVPARVKAGWDAQRKLVVCEPCLDGVHRSSPSLATSGGVDHGVAGRSAFQESSRRSDRAEQAAYRSGVAGEVKTGRVLEVAVGEFGHVLHDRAVPGSAANIDHVVVMSCGVWIVDAKNHRKKVRRRGPSDQPRLHVGGVDHHDLVSGLAWQVDVVRTALDGELVPLFGMLVFSRARFGWWRTSLDLQGVSCCRPAAVRPTLWSRQQVLSKEQVDEIARRLSAALPPA